MGHPAGRVPSFDPLRGFKCPASPPLSSSPPSERMALLLCHVILLAVSFDNVVAASASNAYIVYMGQRRQEEPHLAQMLHRDILSSVLGSQDEAELSILYSYKHGFAGFAAVLTQPQAKRIADIPEVVSVIPNRILQPHTTRSWEFLQLDLTPASGLLGEGRFGGGTIIGVLDTGIWPESQSFKDDGMGEIPDRWNGICQVGEEFNSSHCNRKIIGARWYIKGYEAEFGKLNTSDLFEFLSPRDALGHGTHTSSTAAGSLVQNASFMGLASGQARGGASSAHLAMYKVCWATGECSSADILAAFDDAISDGVDVLSVSLGSPPPLPAYVDDTLAIGSFHAVANGIVVVTSGGNSGPYSQTVINTAPWVLTVAASSIDRAFLTSMTLGNNKILVGQSLFMGKSANKFQRLVYAADVASDMTDDDARGCSAGSLNASLVRGNVVLCFQTRSQRSAVAASKTVRKALGAGLIFAQSSTMDVSSTMGFPCIQIDFEVGTDLLSYVVKTREPVVKFSLTETTIGSLISPEVAFFSSRGPSSLSPFILKPDIAAPGVNILASWSPVSPIRGDTGPLSFKIESGTSMACPHIAAIVALLKAVHPDWSPAALKSALITTASVEDGFHQGITAEGAPSSKLADPFDYGGGHVDPNKAADPGLVYDMSISDHISFLCAMGYNDTAVSLMALRKVVCSGGASVLQKDLNLPSISIPELRGRLTVTRTVKNVGPVNSTYRVSVDPPSGVGVRVDPSVLAFDSSVAELTFKVGFDPLVKVRGRLAFGSLSWKDGVHVVRIPLVVRTLVD